LLFVAWYGVSSVSAGSGSLAQLQMDNEKLRSDLNAANQTIAELRPSQARVKFYEEILSQLAIHLDKPAPPTSADELLAWLKEHDEYVKQVAKRGSPMCSPTANVIARAMVLGGTARLTVLRDIGPELQSPRT